VPVRISDAVSGEQAPTKFYAGVIVVEHGRVRLRFEGAVDADSRGSSRSAWADDFAVERYQHMDCRRSPTCGSASPG
jgi:hypothetical protein